MLQPTPKTIDPAIRAMIDDYIAAGRHKVIPPVSKHLKPIPRRLNWDRLTPNAPADAVIRASRSPRRHAPSSASYTESGWPPNHAIVTRIDPCAAAPGSKRAQRYTIYTLGSTIGELRDRGLRLSDFVRDRSASRIGLSTDSESPPSQEDPS